MIFFSFWTMQQNCSEKNRSSASAEHFAITWKSTQLTNRLPGAPVLAQTLPTLQTRFAIFLGSGTAILTAVFPVLVELVFLEAVLTYLWILLSGITKNWFLIFHLNLAGRWSDRRFGKATEIQAMLVACLNTSSWKDLIRGPVLRVRAWKRILGN